MRVGVFVIFSVSFGRLDADLTIQCEFEIGILDPALEPVGFRICTERQLAGSTGVTVVVQTDVHFFHFENLGCRAEWTAERKRLVELVDCIFAEEWTDEVAVISLALVRSHLLITLHLLRAVVSEVATTPGTLQAEPIDLRDREVRPEPLSGSV